ncbi:hypothetical protein RBB79_12460 [Tunturiibacter empetritectus]|uniref:Uncharacterized protein n=1 Tax=Tunturiibacter lichenicola TaxID=2051959 RepID=A0A852VIY2_9BACT|nr:hypothetical protein [Edaphobacter lichenicola]NYF90404.1 hypothetical protein [Edaphobacter lichenicola]
MPINRVETIALIVGIRLSFGMVIGIFIWPCAHCQSLSITIPIGTPLPIKAVSPSAMRIGEQVRAELMYPVYVNDELVLPENTPLNGTITALDADRSRRIHARLRGDFTPFHTPVVRFDQLVAVDGSIIAVTTYAATKGAKIYRVIPNPPRTGSFLSRQLSDLKQVSKSFIATFTGPDKEDRFKQFIYSQIPWHPERIERETAWTVETSAPLIIPTQPQTQSSDEAGMVTGRPPIPTEITAGKHEPTWLIRAYLSDDISSLTSKSGQAISARVAEPILNSEGSVVVPQGSVILGAVSQAKPARSWGRAGILRFRFHQLEIHGQTPLNVDAVVNGIDSSQSSAMIMNSEGEVKPKPQNKVVIPIILAALASRPFDGDGGALVKNGAASGGLGLIGFIVGTAAGQRNIAAGIG